MGHRRIVFAIATLLAAGAALFASIGANAQTGRNYDVKTMNFDLWCQEQQHLPVDRCDKRLPGDDQAFRDYRASIERYEVPYLQQQRDDILLDRNILHNDPVDNPAIRNPSTMQQQLTPGTPPPAPRQ